MQHTLQGEIHSSNPVDLHRKFDQISIGLNQEWLDDHAHDTEIGDQNLGQKAHLVLIKTHV